MLPVYEHSFVQKRDMPRFEHRLAMAKLAFEELPGARLPIRVLDVERTVAQAWERGAAESDTQTGSRPGTIDVVRYLARLHPGIRFALLLGADTFRDLVEGRWKESQALRELVDTLVVPRHGVALPKDVVPASDPPEVTDVSSSLLRGTVDEVTWRKNVFPAVFDYVVKHRLYRFG